MSTKEFAGGKRRSGDPMSKVPQDAQYVITPQAVYKRDMVIPEGFEYGGFRVPCDGETFLSKEGRAVTMGHVEVASQDGPRIIVRRVLPKPHRFDSGGRRVSGGVADRPCATCGLPDRDPIHKVAQPRRWIVEQSPDDAEELRPGQILRRSQWRVIREVQPFTSHEVNRAWEQLGCSGYPEEFLRRLGIEVED